MSVYSIIRPIMTTNAVLYLIRMIYIHFDIDFCSEYRVQQFILQQWDLNCRRFYWIYVFQYLWTIVGIRFGQESIRMWRSKTWCILVKYIYLFQLHLEIRELLKIKDASYIYIWLTTLHRFLCVIRISNRLLNQPGEIDTISSSV